MELLSNISCCFDATKDIGETSVELVVCDLPVSKRCCLRWETFIYVAALAFSLTDFVADLFGYISFVSIVANPKPIQPYIDAWLAFLIVSAVIIISEVALPIYSISKITDCCGRQAQTEDESDRFRTTAKYWGRANNIAVIFTEDGVIALIRILIAFKSMEAVSDLQTTTGAVTSCIAFVVTVLRHCMLIAQVVAKFSRNEVMFSKSPKWSPGYCTKGTCGLIFLFFVTIFLSCGSLSLTGLSMAISLKLFEVHYDDNSDFILNITVLALIVPATFIFSVFVIIQTRW